MAKKHSVTTAKARPVQVGSDGEAISGDGSSEDEDEDEDEIEDDIEDEIDEGAEVKVGEHLLESDDDDDDEKEEDATSSKSSMFSDDNSSWLKLATEGSGSDSDEVDEFDFGTLLNTIRLRR